MKESRYKRPHIVQFHSIMDKMSIIDKSIEAESRLIVVGKEEMGMMKCSEIRLW